MKVGDKIKLEFDNPANTDHLIVGTVVQVFDALTKQGESGINLEIDIRYGKGKSKWFRYKPEQDGGTLTILESK